MGPVKLVAVLVSLLFRAGCAAGPIFPGPEFPPNTVTESAWPTVAACLAATHEGSLRSGDESRACVRVDLVNASSPSLVLQALQVELDGTLLFARQEPSGGRGDLDFTRAFTLSLGHAAAGPHELRLAAWLEVNPREAPWFSRGTRIGVCSRHRFTVAAGGAISLTAFLSDEGDKHTSIPERLGVTYAEDRDAKHPGQREPQDVSGDGGSQCPRAAQP
jgi:hypothetical protein